MALSVFYFINTHRAVDILLQKNALRDIFCPLLKTTDQNPQLDRKLSSKNDILKHMSINDITV